MSNKRKHYKDLSNALRENLLKRKHQMKERKNSHRQNNSENPIDDLSKETNVDAPNFSTNSDTIEEKKNR